MLTLVTQDRTDPVGARARRASFIVRARRPRLGFSKRSSRFPDGRVPEPPARSSPSHEGHGASRLASRGLKVGKVPAPFVCEGSTASSCSMLE